MGHFDENLKDMGDDFSDPESRDQTPYPQHSKDRTIDSYLDGKPKGGDNSVSPVSGYAGVDNGHSDYAHSINKGLHAVGKKQAPSVTNKSPLQPTPKEKGKVGGSLDSDSRN